MSALNLRRIKVSLAGETVFFDQSAFTNQLQHDLRSIYLLVDFDVIFALPWTSTYYKAAFL